METYVGHYLETYHHENLFRVLKGILLEWDHPAQDDRVFETELDVSRHPENEDQRYITKMLVVEDVQVEDSGIYTCKVRVSKIKDKSRNDYNAGKK